MPDSLAHSAARPPCDQEASDSISAEEIAHEMFSTVILSLPLIHEGQLSVSGERMCTSTG